MAKRPQNSKPKERFKSTKSKSAKPRFKRNTNPVKTNHADTIRLNKFIANSGICSRREADENIALGLVTVNGKVITKMGFKVDLSDKVMFDGRRIFPEPNVYVLLNKPKGFATTTSQTKGKTVMDLVANATAAQIKPIGRLGRNSVGLLLFTNDAELVKKFTQSKTGVVRLFEIELDKNLKYKDLLAIKNGIKIGDKIITVEDISYVDNKPKNVIGIKIKNTGNSVLRALFEPLQYNILKIDCVAIGNLTKKDLPRGHFKHLSQKEIRNLKML